MSETAARVVTAPKPRRDLARAVVRFAGDSGDGMQLTGEQFTLESAGYAANPLDDPTLAERYRLHKVDMTALTLEAIQDLPLNTKEKDRTKNFFALGLVSWIYTRPLDPTLDWIKKKFAKNATIAEANARVLKAGHAFGETAEIFSECYQLEPAEMAPGLYRAMTGNRALAWGLLAAAERSKVPIVYGAYPITPASSILEELAMHKRFRVRTIQAEDEIAAVTAAIGASFGGDR